MAKKHEPYTESPVSSERHCEECGKPMHLRCENGHILWQCSNKKCKNTITVR